MKQRICSLRPNVTEEEAIEYFSGCDLPGFLRRLTVGPLRYVAPFYIPFRIVQVTIENHETHTTCSVAVDAIIGSLDVYCFDKTPITTIVVETRNRATPRLSDSEASQIAKDKSCRLLFRKGFFRLRQLNIHAIAIGELHVPYWMGFYGRGAVVHLSVIDAVRRTHEGAKTRRLIHKHLMSN